MALNYFISITGDCQNTSSGIMELFPSGGVSPYIIDWYSPNLGIDPGITTSSIRTGLSAGTYQFLITDSTSPTPQTLYGSALASSGVCCSVYSVNDTTCDLDNGQISVTATTFSLSANYYLYSTTNGYITSGSTFSGLQIFNSLSADTYYVNVFDGGGCSGNTGTVTIGNSSSFDFGLYAIDNSNCSGIPTGKIYVTGQTGYSPYTYLWSPYGQTTSSITGLTAGTYSVTVTNSGGCSLQKSIDVLTVPKLGVVNMVTTPPSCFQSDGAITVNLSGGTPPFYYQLSNGQNDISYSSSFTYNNLSSGIYTVNVTDAGLCTSSGVITLSTPNSFTVVGVSSQNSTCNSNNGSITASVVGGASPYTYNITDTHGNSTTSATTATSVVFNNLPTGLYTLTISNSSSCSYQTLVFISNDNKFTLSYNVTNTSCGLTNGSIEITPSVPGIYTYQIPGQTIPNTSLPSVTFSNLNSAVYNVIVTDTTGCVQTISVPVESSESVQFNLSNTGCGSGSEGTITALITNGKPPFTLSWSPNVGAQTGIYVTNLSAGTYSLLVTDSEGCSLTRSTNITCSSNYVSYQLVNICEGTFVETASSKTGLLQMLNQGYYDLTEGEINCQLQIAQFNVVLNIGDSGYTSNFYTTTSLLDVPTDQQYVDALNGLLSGVTGLGSFYLNAETNTLQLTTNCEKYLSDKNVKIDIKIIYNICCETPPPTPTATPTPTPTSLPVMCFEYCDVTTDYVFDCNNIIRMNIVSSGTLYGKYYWILPTTYGNTYVWCNGDTIYADWQWGASLGDQFSQYSNLFNVIDFDPTNSFPISGPDPLNTWDNGAVINSSYLGPCITPTPTPTQTLTTTPTLTPTNTPTPTPTPTIEPICPCYEWYWDRNNSTITGPNPSLYYYNCEGILSIIEYPTTEDKGIICVSANTTPYWVDITGGILNNNETCCQIYKACWYSMVESPDFVIDVLGPNCRFGGGGLLDLSVNSVVVNGTELITGMPYSDLVTVGNVNIVPVLNDVISGCTMGGTTGHTYLNFVQLMNSVFYSLGLTNYSAQVSGIAKTGLPLDVTSTAGFYIISPLTDTFSIKVASAASSGYELIYYSDGTVTLWDGITIPMYYGSTCDGINLVYKTVIE